MAHLTKPVTYDIESSNIALLGSEIEKRVREHAGDSESSWEDVGTRPGLRIWRIENFNVVDWPKDRYGSFYDGDSYIVLHTYKKDPKSEALSYDLHFWLGAETSQDEAGTAAYKTVELDDHLKGSPLQHREVQGFESSRFLSYFPRCVILRGGVSTGFHHVSAPPPLNVKRLYRISATQSTFSTEKSTLVVREVRPEAASLVEGDVFVLDKGVEVWQLNTKASVGKEKFKAAEFVQSVISDREGQCRVVVYDEGSSGAGIFLSEFGVETLTSRGMTDRSVKVPVTLYRVTDSIGTVKFERVSPPTRSSFDSGDAFLIDNSADVIHPAIFIWIGKDASLKERRLAVQYAQQHLYNKRGAGELVHMGVSIIRMNEGSESEEFINIINAQ